MPFFKNRRGQLIDELHETVAYVHKRLRIDRDLLRPEEIARLHVAADEAEMGLESKSESELQAASRRLTELLERSFPSDWTQSWRENGEVLLVAVLMAMAFRAYFLQPFRIPTGSMQPTLYGITSEPMQSEMPSRPMRWIHRWLIGRKYVEVRARSDGTILKSPDLWNGDAHGVPAVRAKPRVPLPLIGPIVQLLFPRSEFQLGEELYQVPVDPSDLLRLLAGKNWYRTYHKGDEVLHDVLISGDSLMVDRFSYNFRRPKVGDIFVFETKDIPALKLDQGKFFIKRCLGLPGETLRIGDDDHVYIDGKAIPPVGPFAKIYSKKNGYYGHLNETRMRQAIGEVGPIAHLHTANDTYQLPPHTYWAMGDNTRGSKDSRYFGPVPEKNLVGRAFFVYWPFTKRWGRPE